MKRSLRGGVRLASVVLSLGLAGCGGGGIEEGMPADTSKSAAPITPDMTPTTGMGPGAYKKAQAGQAKAAKEGPASTGDETPAEKK
jgi:hypothetical protein